MLSPVQAAVKSFSWVKSDASKEKWLLNRAWAADHLGGARGPGTSTAPGSRSL